jgi:hypothetical protein
MSVRLRTFFMLAAVQLASCGQEGEATELRSFRAETRDVDWDEQRCSNLFIRGEGCVVLTESPRR